MPFGARPARKSEQKRKTTYYSSKVCLPSEVLRVSGPSFSLPAAWVGSSAGRFLAAPDFAEGADSGAPVDSSVRPADLRQELSERL